MSNETRLLIGWVVISSLVLANTADCDNQSDPGSAVHILGGDGNFEIKAGPLQGTYRTKAQTKYQQTACRWRVYHADARGRWRQTSPKAIGEWNRVGSVFHRGSVKLNGHALFQTRACAPWKMTK